MALDLGALNDFFDGSIRFELAGNKHPKGKEYHIPPIAADLGLWGRRVAVARGELADLDDDALIEAAERVAKEVGDPPIPEGLTYQEALLSPELVAELAADQVPDPAVQHLAKIVYARIVGGDELALKVARGEFDPNPGGPANRQERRATAKKAPKKVASASRTTSTAKAATTRKPAIGSGTKSPRAGAAAKKVSRGGRS